MKHLIIMLLAAHTLIANAEPLSNFIDISENLSAAVAYDGAPCLAIGTGYGEDLLCSTTKGNVFSAPTVFIYNSKGNIQQSIIFFDDQCAYNPLNLSARGQTLTLTAAVNRPFGGPLIDTPFTTGDPLNPIFDYSNCKHAPGTTLRETRHLRNGRLIKKIMLEDYRSAVVR